MNKHFIVLGSSKFNFYVIKLTRIVKNDIIRSIKTSSHINKYEINDIN